MVVDVLFHTADNNGDIDKRDIVRVPPGSIEHGEYIIDMLSIPGRTYKLFKIGGLRYQSEEVCRNKNLQLKEDKRLISSRTSS